MKIIQTTNLTKYYGKIRGILDVNLEVDEGDVFGFIGPNGAGKSTTIRLLLNFLYPSSGSANIFGLDVINSSKEIRQNIGYLPSEVNYYGEMKVRELLKYSASFYSDDYTKDIIELANRFQLNLNRNIDELSYGNKKKTAIVQALLHKPKLLILDEPTGGLDPLMQNIFFESLREENSKNTTIFFSSHVLSEVQKLCNKIAIIKQGKILKVEDISNLRKSNFKTITLSIRDNLEPQLDISGIIKKETLGSSYKFLFNGELKRLLYLLSQQEIENIVIEEPSLEEIFIHYYEKEE